jgi:dephospho-CoA kinase
MIKIGVTGRIASGKSEFCKYLSEYTKFPIIDADQLSREVCEKGSEAVTEIEMTFGSRYITNGELNRKKLAEKVFQDQEARHQLNAILHYRITQKYFELLDRYEKINIKGIIYDCPLLFEAKVENTVDVAVLIYSDYEIQLDRLVHIRNMSVDEAKNRIASQMPFEEQKSHADVLVTNNKSLGDLRADIPKIYEQIKEILGKKNLLHN